MRGNGRKKRIPKLKYTKTRNIGWHVAYRDPKTGMPKKHRFKVADKGDAEKAYHEWVTEFLEGKVVEKRGRSSRLRSVPGLETEHSEGVVANITEGSLVHVTSGLLKFEESRVRKEGEARRRGTITKGVYNDRKNYAKEFLSFVDSRHGDGAVGNMRLGDLRLEDIESYNRRLVEAGYSASQVTKRLRFIQAIVSRAGRPEFGGQALSWNWAALDVLHGKAAQPRTLPSLKQLKLVLQKCGVRERAIVWLGIGCGFGQRDIAAIHVDQFDEESYDLRRGKTGIERYGETPKIVWKAIEEYLGTVSRGRKGLMFVTRKGKPLVHGNTDSVSLWWARIRKKLEDDGKDLDGFYILRHLGATEFGSRKGCSIGELKRWLGHSSSSHIADTYMRPVSPENRAVVNWVRESLKSGKMDLKITD